MKRFLRYTFFSKYTLLLAATVLIVLSYVFNTYYTNVTSVVKERKLLEKYINQQEQDFSDLLHDTLLLRKLIRRSETLEEFQKLESRPYGFFLSVENVSGNFNMLFWNDQLILPKASNYFLPDGETFQKLDNGYYVVEKRTVKINGMSNNIVAFAMIPVHFEYYVDAPDLPREFPYSKTAEQKILIAKNPTANPIHSLSGNTLFYIDKKAYVAIPYNDVTTLLFRLGGLFLLLLFVHLVAETIARQSRAWKAVTFITVCLVVIRVIMYQWPSLLNQRQFAIFDPSIYGSDVIQKSLGDLLANAIVFCWIVVFTWSKISHKESFLVLRTK
ncbi:MAG: hypothetical protein ABUT20_33615, partial [Bacteroidota bacterium]